MSQTLTPKYAAYLASNVYDIKSVITREDFLDEYKSDMEISSAKIASGVTGGYILNKPHVMAVFSAGKGEYKGQAFVAIKGTASLYDALTDLNTGLRTSHTGCSVHQGFYYAFNSILPELRQFVSGLNGVAVVHCVGHSLGGAIATLAADWIRAASAVPSVKLYSFGSPRVGLEMFANKCTTQVKAENIYRAHHQTDPIPMVPTWPFYHVPASTVGYLIYSPVATKPWEYHLMKHYIASAKKAGSWSTIKNNRPAGYLDATVERWLKSDGVLSFTANTLELLNAALLYVIKKVVNVAGVLLVAAAASAFTLLDRMAIFMAKAAKLSVDVSVWVFHLVKKMAALIGVVVKKGTDLTVEFIRAVFLRLHQKLSNVIWQASKEIS
jgi:hypothetical protein